MCTKNLLLPSQQASIQKQIIDRKAQVMAGLDFTIYAAFIVSMLSGLEHWYFSMEGHFLQRMSYVFSIFVFSLVVKIVIIKGTNKWIYNNFTVIHLSFIFLSINEENLFLHPKEYDLTPM
jgi:hypothetical protein